ncbi:GNAT family N-acetyltransferase [Halobacillus salinarum]|uniref:GNAT family N-acetyltransferase n=1 Tax=Halobacillus salinarum TaxID=2932257 RepID=A0ABY4EK72_9BACI|nr:GNAT family N-acetyltransferase [Halobacillus salinarum]UOQ44871.1 GNAT family N-acetyltransferase [Halobacillus salinarum]
MQEQIKIVPLTNDLIKDVNAVNDPFPIFGKIVPSFHHGSWSTEEVLFAEPEETSFPDDHLDWESYIDRDEKALFLAYLHDECIGQLRIIKDFTRFCYIENIAVKKEVRKHGVGALLLKKAEEWARGHQLIGLSLETQDDNLAACRFYMKHGFQLGGMDLYRHLHNPHIDKALFWYKPF